MVNSPSEEGDKLREAADLIKLCEFQDFVREFFFLFFSFFSSQCHFHFHNLQVVLILKQ